ncbi:MAG: hypothetical protein M3350_07945, partial [Actinomycetota bacterium]|nr:hypothetical protein [Actinomycetota bacterium]MDQ3720692.1 hypothetical protein [Actinomycetota bacterium]
MLIAVAVAGGLKGEGPDDRGRGAEPEIGPGADGRVVRCSGHSGTFGVTRSARGRVSVTARRPVSVTVSQSATEQGEGGSVTVTATVTRRVVARATVAAGTTAPATIKVRGRARVCVG